MKKIIAGFALFVCTVSPVAAFADGRITVPGLGLSQDQVWNVHPTEILPGNNGNYYARFISNDRSGKFIDVMLSTYSDASALFHDMSGGASILCVELKKDDGIIPRCVVGSVSLTK